MPRLVFIIQNGRIQTQRQGPAVPARLLTVDFILQQFLDRVLSEKCEYRAAFRSGHNKGQVRRMKSASQDIENPGRASNSDLSNRTNAAPYHLVLPPRLKYSSGMNCLPFLFSQGSLLLNTPWLITRVKSSVVPSLGSSEPFSSSNTCFPALTSCGTLPTAAPEPIMM